MEMASAMCVLLIFTPTIATYKLIKSLLWFGVVWCMCVLWCSSNTFYYKLRYSISYKFKGAQIEMVKLFSRWLVKMQVYINKTLSR